MVLKVKDYVVSGEVFELRPNHLKDMLETVPQPSADVLPEYYKSEDYISHTDAKRNLFEKLYHLIKGVALKRKLKLINQLSEQKSLLDIGCGTGDFLQTAANDGWQINGIEPNEHARTIANHKTNETVFDTQQLHHFEAASFDVITLWHVLEHLPNLEEHFAIFNNLLKKDGKLVIAVPNYKSYDAQVYKEFWAAYDVPRHLWHFSQDGMKRLGSRAQMEVLKILPMTFDAFYVSLLSEKYKSGKINFLKGFLNGWRSNRSARRSGEYSSLIYVFVKQKPN